MRQGRNPRFPRSAFSALLLPLLFFGWLSAAVSEAPSGGDLTKHELAAHARYLASDELTGRGVGTPGIELARDYIAREFARYGLQPGGDNSGYLQTFEVTTGVKVAEPSFLRLHGYKTPPLHSDWIPLGLSQSGRAEGELVFAGYGISAKDYGYDDYHGIDVRGKIVLVLRYEPVPKNPNSPFRKAPQFSRHATLRSKASNAREHGARAMLLVDLNQSAGRDEELIPPSHSLARSDASLIAAQVKRSAIEPWLEQRGISLAALKEKIDGSERPASIALPELKVSLAVTLHEIRGRADNVVGYLPGSDRHVEPEHIVIGAHFDHLGLGSYGAVETRSRGKIHHGADDNASGTAVLLSVARQLASAQKRPARSVVFVAFSAEELGLHGSRHYTTRPALPIESAVAMINLDMVGRLRENRLTAFGSRSASALSGVISEQAAKLALEIRESDAIGRSDNLSFYNKKVPAVHFFTGMHSDYHRPTDTWDKLNYDGMSRIGALVLAVTERLANSPETPAFVALSSRPPGLRTSDGPRLRSYLGSVPEYDAANDGVKLAAVAPGSPAANAGLRPGDIITHFAGARIESIDDLMGQLNSKKPGEEVEIIVRRAERDHTVKATLTARD
jgi:hypothetical protein